MIRSKLKKSALIILILTCILLAPGNRRPVPLKPAKIAEPESSSAKPVSADIIISSVGDILIHNTVYMAAYNPADNSYNFNSQFQYVKPYLQDADLTIANLETTLAGPEKGYSGYPRFNSPDSLVDALAYAGVDILTAANNHRLDQGVEGFYRTIRVVRQKGLAITGVKAEENEKTYVLREIKGMKVAVLNFGYGYPLAGGNLSINGLILPVNMKGLIDSFDPGDLQKSAGDLAKRISSARQDGAGLVIVCLHWGDEYSRVPNAMQEKLAAAIVSAGADVIFGGHPHVLQPAVCLPSPDGRLVPVFYSQGNFISDQRKETVNNVYTEQGMIAKVTFRVEKNQKPRFKSAEAIPTWVNKKQINGKLVYEIIPAQDALTGKNNFPLLNRADLARIKFCSDTVDGLSKGLRLN